MILAAPNVPGAQDFSLDIRRSGLADERLAVHLLNRV